MVKSKRDLSVKSPRRNAVTNGRVVATRSTTKVEASANIQVVVRVRPPLSRESEYHNSVIRITSDNMLVFDPREDDKGFFYHGIQQRRRDLLKRPNKHLQFLFDRVFGYEDTNDKIFEFSTKPLIQHLMDGYNCSVFVYGATGAGKTHTMLGRTDNPGITPLTMHEMFRCRETLSAERDFELGITYLEVYNETVQDLLNPGTELQLREDARYGVVVAGIKVKHIDNPEELFALLERGNQNRTQHPTDANAESSRSHAIFQLYLKMTMKVTGQVRMAKLSMIDLAGSERGAATGYSGARFTEGANINKSLLALGNCINSLADGQKYVPYRDSKLTRLLKDSLGGNCRTIMIANVSSTMLNYEDTYNTLKYATRAKKIKSSMRKNIVTDKNMGNYTKIFEQMTQENSDLKSENAKLKAMNEELKAANEELVNKISEIESLVAAGEYVPNNKIADKTQIVDTHPANEEKREEVIKIFASLKEAELQLHRVECCDILHSMRKQRKEEIDARLSILCPNSSEKEQGRKRLRTAVNKINRQNSAFQSEISILKETKEQLESQLQKIIEEHPHLTAVVEVEQNNISAITAANKNEHSQKICNVLMKEIRCQNQMVDQLANSYQSCFLQLCGHGYVTDSMKQDHNDITNQLRGMHNVTWDDQVDSNEPLPQVVEPEESCSPPKRKMEEPKLASPLDSTFVLPTAKENKVQIITVDNMMRKVYKKMPGGPIRQPMPHAKENKGPFRTGALQPRKRDFITQNKMKVTASGAAGGRKK